MNEPDGSSKTLLSKSALYAPLAAYEQNKFEPSEYANEQTRIPKSTMESTLTLFLRGVSQTYHRKRARSCDPKNNGSRPQSLLDVDGSIRQKAVTLLGGGGGGGINSSASADNNATKNNTNKKRRKKRRRKSFDEVKQFIFHDSLNDDADDDLRKNELHFLKELNESWNEYITDIIQLNDNDDGGDSMVGEDDVVINRAKGIFSAERSSKLELIGAQIRISSCNQKRNVIGKFGILVGESMNTWKVRRIQHPGQITIQKLEKKKEDDSKNKNKNATSSPKSSSSDDNKKLSLISSSKKQQQQQQQQQTTIIVPKRGSTIDLLIPISPHPNPNHLEQDTTTAQTQTMKPPPSKYITIKLNPNDS